MIIFSNLDNIIGNENIILPNNVEENTTIVLHVVGFNSRWIEMVMDVLYSIVDETKNDTVKEQNFREGLVNSNRFHKADVWDQDFDNEPVIISMAFSCSVYYFFRKNIGIYIYQI